MFRSTCTARGGSGDIHKPSSMHLKKGSPKPYTPTDALPSGPGRLLNQRPSTQPTGVKP